MAQHASPHSSTDTRSLTDALPSDGQVQVQLSSSTAAKLAARRARANLKLELRARRAEAARAERVARAEEASRRRDAHTDQKRERRGRFVRALASASVQWRPIAPIVLVTGCAMYGQVGYGFAHYSPEGTPDVGRLAVAVIVAVAVEYIALYVQWHAHDALLRKASSTAARLRYASYALALAVAGVNYAHFAGEGLTPTPGAVVFALFSASGPWLWGLHTRRAQNKQLIREGRADSTGAVFSAERFRNFPIRTIKARRYSIDHGITDPQVAWEAYRLELERRHDDLPAAWQQMALGLLRLDQAKDHAEWAANMVSSIAVPELEQLDDLDPMDWWRTAALVDEPHVAQRDDVDDQEPTYRDESLPLEQRIDLAIAAELAAGATRPPGRRRLAALLGLPDPYPVRAVLEARSRNGHRPQEIAS